MQPGICLIHLMPSVALLPLDSQQLILHCINHVGAVEESTSSRALAATSCATSRHCVLHVHADMTCVSPLQATGTMPLQEAAYQNHAEANRHPEHGGDKGNLGRPPGLVTMRQVRGGRLAGKVVAKEDRLCAAARAELQRPEASADVERKQPTPQYSFHRAHRVTHVIREEK